MNAGEVVGRLRTLFGAPEFDIGGEDCSFHVSVVAEEFAGLKPVQRQQKVLSAFASELASGELHALTVQAFTPDEWEARACLTSIQL